ncbi:phospholipase D family protein [Chengkuizengella axinellae]|uniref:phospholipase D n=1 Tax=Chengkuizengella axinellae TaxID=3064388 RepID=A0ABT9IVI1_9BACL|nr:phospholipase D family protein [Chengkuizengella sp. 2205SS18-9]MDP5272819.1 phospholipase D family protein [Chengkuizengella sp. 2205SS18-9]
MKKLKVLLLFVIVISMLTSIYNVYKPLPDGISVNGNYHNVTNVEFLNDLTYQKDGEIVYEQVIFDRIYQMIDEAEEFILVDAFLFNDEYERQELNSNTGEFSNDIESVNYPNITEQLTNHLILKKQQNPHIEIVFITDEINTFYGSYSSHFIEKLKENDVEVVFTDMTKLRDSNPIYSGFWRSFVKWFGTSDRGWITNPFSLDSPDVSLRSYLKLVNFRANHRKVFLTEKEAIVSSANPHDPSGYHSNIAFLLEGGILQDIFEAERAVAKLSGVEIEKREFSGSTGEAKGDLKAKVITEGEIGKEIQQNILETSIGDEIKIGVFYLSERNVIKSLIDAAEKGVKIQIILDPNKDAFGMEKNGIPNRQVSSELINEGNGNIEVRWYDTQGEQFHSKFLMINKKHETIVTGGSANFTRRNIGDYNLEMNIQFIIPEGHPLEIEMNAYFVKLWNNEEGQYTIDYNKYQDDSIWKKVLYRIQEFSGLSTF